MSRLDDRLTRELERTARPADPSGVFERIDRRRGRRHAVRRAGSAALAVVVIAGSVGGFVFLSDAFGPARTPGGETPVQHANGLLVVSKPDAFGLGDLYSVEPSVDPASRGQRQLTMSSASDGAASVSPDGRTIAFVRTDDTGSAIFTIGIDGTELRQISDAAIDPAWSPDGSRIAFVRGAHGQDGIWTMTPDGGDAKLIAGTDALVTGNPAWSPDGTSIAFEGASLDSQAVHICDIYTIPVGATGPQDLHRLTDTPDLNEISPSWAPDGARIVFSQFSTHPNIDKTGGIAVMEADGSDVVFLTSGGPNDNNPSWSPDGSLIAFDRSILTHPPMVFTVRPDGTDLTQITGASEPAWQPIPAGADPSATPTTGKVDLGLGFPVCNVRILGGDAQGDLAPDFDGDGRVDTAYLATKKSDVGGCPQADTASNILGIDLTGDGRIDAEYGPIGCQLDCRPFLAIDLDDDGDDELLVQQLGGAILGLVPYELVRVDGSEGSPTLSPLAVVPPGDPENGFAPGGPVTFYIGGDEGFSASLDCRGSGVERILVATTGQLDSIEQPTRWTMRRTTFRLGSQGLEVLDTETFDQLIKAAGTLGSEQAPSLCGVPFPPNPVFEIP